MESLEQQVERLTGIELATVPPGPLRNALVELVDEVEDWRAGELYIGTDGKQSRIGDVR